MRFLHLSDLHLGKKLGEYSLNEDQEHILKQILAVIDSKKPDAVLVSGDVFDKTVPTEDAIKMWDSFLDGVSVRKTELFAISGNHDSAIRFSSHHSLIHGSGIHFSEPYGGRMSRFVLKDEYGVCNVYLLPFVKPSTVRNFFPEKEINSYDEAVAAVIENEAVSKDERNVILSHQFVTGGMRSDSEEQVGNIDNIDASLYDDFDYVALGHLHRGQCISRKEVRYSGSPLKYSLSEKDDKKSVSLIELREKGNVIIEEIVLKPLRDVVEIKGSFKELTSNEETAEKNKTSFVYAVLTDEEEEINVLGKLRSVFPNLVSIRYDNSRTRSASEIDFVSDIEEKSPIELFSLFFKMQNSKELNAEQEKFIKKEIEELNDPVSIREAV